MDQKARFKVAVLALCADQGMSLGETLLLVKQANQTHAEKRGEGMLAKMLLGLGGTAAGLAKYPVYAALLAPPIAGAVGGWGLARATAGINDRTSKEVKHQEMIDELRRQAAHARVQTSMAQRRKTRESRRGRSLL